MEKQISFFILGFVAALSVTSLLGILKPADPTRADPRIFTLKLDPASRAVALNLLEQFPPSLPGPTP